LQDGKQWPSLCELWLMSLYGRWRPLSIGVQGNLCGREAVSCSCRRRLRGKFCADGSHETLQCHATKPLYWESWSCRWSGLPALPISLRVNSFCGVMQRDECLCHLHLWILMNRSWELPQLSRQLAETR
jgi:hypothetical protein